MLPWFIQSWIKALQYLGFLFYFGNDIISSPIQELD